jgi:hypothetical protein
MAQHTLTLPAEGVSRAPYRNFTDPDIYREELVQVFLGPT